MSERKRAAAKRAGATKAKAKKQTGARRPGRPTAYRQAFCQKLREYFERDPHATLDEFAAAVLRVCPNAVREWAQKHPEFGEAVAAAKTVKCARIERWMSETAAGDRPGNSGMLIFLAKNYMPTRFKDKQEVEHSGAIDMGAAILAARRARAGLGPDENDAP